MDLAAAEQLEAFEAKRFDAAHELMPYCHARLASIDARVEATMAHEDWLERIEMEERGEI